MWNNQSDVICIFSISYRLAYFEINNKVYTQDQLIQVAIKHYTSQVNYYLTHEINDSKRFAAKSAVLKKYRGGLDQQKWQDGDNTSIFYSFPKRVK